MYFLMQPMQCLSCIYLVGLCGTLPKLFILVEEFSYGSKSELDPVVLKQQSARPKLSGDVREKLKKATADQSGTVGFVQLSMQPHSSQLVLQDPDLGINTPTGRHPKISQGPNGTLVLQVGTAQHLGSHPTISSRG
jgi:hypothetical protein